MDFGPATFQSFAKELKAFNGELLRTKAKNAHTKKVYNELMEMSSLTESNGVFESLIEHHFGTKRASFCDVTAISNKPSSTSALNTDIVGITEKNLTILFNISFETSFQDVSNDMSHDRIRQERNGIFQTVEFTKGTIFATKFDNTLP